jgi:RNA polymerase sigma-70 factor (ECF subfamily)
MRGRPEDDAALVARARRGDRSAMEVLLDRHYDRIATIARRMLQHRADAEDATQQALIAVVRGLPRFDGRSAVSTWIHRVAVNACLDELRRRQRRPRPLDLDDPAEGATTAGTSDGGLGQVAERVDLDRALDALAPDFRAAVVLRDLCGLDYAEIADCLGVPPGTVRSRIARGRRDLLAALGNRGQTADVQGSER